MPIDIEQRLRSIEKKLRADLEMIRASFNHSGNRGTSLEKAFRRYLRDHLPRNLEIGEGEVIDTHGHAAGTVGAPGQIDVVIVNDSHPRTFSPESPGTFFIEGVVAAGEVKTALTTQHLLDTLKKAADFKVLSPRPGAVRYFVNKSDEKRFYDRRPYFLFSIESTITVENIIGHVTKFAEERNVVADDIIDAIFIMDRGSLINLGDGEGSLQMRDPAGNRIIGWAATNNLAPMVEMIGWLSAVMPIEYRFTPVLPLYMPSYVQRPSTP